MPRAASQRGSRWFAPFTGTPGLPLELRKQRLLLKHMQNHAPSRYEATHIPIMVIGSSPAPQLCSHQTGGRGRRRPCPGGFGEHAYEPQSMTWCWASHYTLRGCRGGQLAALRICTHVVYGACKRHRIDPSQAPQAPRVQQRWISIISEAFEQLQ